jgi:hypothetical protein
VNSSWGLRGRPRFTTIQARPRAGPRGETYELRWAAVGASHVEVDGYGLHRAMGSVRVAFDGTPSPVVTAYGPGGSRSQRGPETVTFEPPVIGFTLPVAARDLVGGGQGDAGWPGAEAPLATDLLAAPGTPAAPAEGPDWAAPGWAPPRAYQWLPMLWSPAASIGGLAGAFRSVSAFFGGEPAPAPVRRGSRHGGGDVGGTPGGRRRRRATEPTDGTASTAAQTGD